MLLTDFLKGMKNSRYLLTRDASITIDVTKWQKQMERVKANRFVKGSGVYNCLACGKATRETGSEESKVELCRQCYEENIKQNSKDSQPEIDFQGLKVVIENEVGSIRKGAKEDGTKWQTKFIYPYGYIANAIKDGDDGEEIDCYVGPNPNAGIVYIIHQIYNEDYDELKCMLGFNSEEEAKEAYIYHYDISQPLGVIIEMTMNDFKSFIGVQEV